MRLPLLWGEALVLIAAAIPAALVLRWAFAPGNLRTLQAGVRTTPGHSCPLYPNKRVVLVTVNEHYLDFFENWMLHAKPFWDPHFNQLVVSAESVAVAPMLRALSGVSPLPFDVLLDGSWDWGRNCTSGCPEPAVLPYWLNEPWARVVTHRPRQIARLVAAGCSVLYQDLDTAWLKDVFAIVDRHSHSAPLLVTVDRIVEGCKVLRDMSYLCTCFLYFRPEPGNLELLAAWGNSSENQPQDQMAFNAVLGKPRLTVLPYQQFPPGFCVGSYRQTAAVVHANYFKGLAAKRAFLQGLGLWKATGRWNASTPSAR